MGETCFHCGEPVPPGVHLVARARGHDVPTCCIGCQAAVGWIASLGLDEYYRLRDVPAAPAAVAADCAAWDRPQLQRLYVRDLGDGRREAMVLVEGVRCAACGWLIDRALGALPGVCAVLVNPASRRLHVTWRDDATTLGTLLTALARLGYVAHPLDAATLDGVALRETRTALKALVVAGLGMMQSMMYAVTLYAGTFEGMPSATRDFFRWLGLLVTTPVVFYAARAFFAGALREWRARAVGMDTMIAAAVALIYTASLYETVRGGAQVYFDSASMFVFFLLAGRYLEMRARHRAVDVVDALARLQPALAQRRGDDGRLESVGVHELVPGDIVTVASGAAVPADGRLLGDACEVDESLLTGEAAARTRRRGDRIIAGSIARSGPFDLRVEHIGADTVLSGIVRLISQACAQRPAAARMGDRMAARFVTGVLVLAVATAAAWCMIDPGRAFAAALAVLVVSCPCAFALSVPIAHLRAAAALARIGVLMPRTDALDTLARFDRIAFDKTGTLTENSLELDFLKPHAGMDAATSLAIAAALEAGSLHPLAQAILGAARSRGVVAQTAHAVVAHAGAGVEGTVEGRHYRLGKAAFAAPGALEAIEDDHVYLADASGVLAMLHFRETVRSEAVQALEHLRAQGVEPLILSGDADRRVHAVAARLQVAQWHARLTPADKLASLQWLRQQGHVVAMVGDGINDAPVLAGADVAIALGAGTPLAQSAADVVLASDSLDAIADCRRIAQRTQAVLGQNLAWAFVYNFAGIPLAALGWVPPWLAAIGMSTSALLVVLNSLRIAPLRRADALDVPDRDVARHVDWAIP